MRLHERSHGLPRPSLHTVDGGIRLFLTAFIVAITAGYTIGLLFVHQTTKGSPDGLVEQYRGSDVDATGEEIKYEKSTSEMMMLVHNHVLSLSLVFLSVGAIFACNSIVRGPMRTALLVEPFVALGTTFGGLLLVRFVAPWFNWLVILSGISMALCYVVMVAVILVDLWRRS